MNMTLSALLPGTALPSHLAAVAVPGIAMDTRRLNAGDLFMAVPGEQVDGRAFIPDAIRAGACAVLTESSQ
ncbi:MAG: Mur ligase domain-containing protein, partial [Alcanivoracaceae bacterium]